MRITFRSQAIRTAAGSLILLYVTAGVARAQPFANVKQSLVDYSRTDVEPRVPCDRLAATFKSKELAGIEASSVAAAGLDPIATIPCRRSSTG